MYRPSLRCGRRRKKRMTTDSRINRRPPSIRTKRIPLPTTIHTHPPLIPAYPPRITSITNGRVPSRRRGRIPPRMRNRSDSFNSIHKRIRYARETEPLIPPPSQRRTQTRSLLFIRVGVVGVGVIGAVGRIRMRSLIWMSSAYICAQSGS